MDKRSDQSNDEPNPKRPRIESEASTSTSSSSSTTTPVLKKDPFLSLPSDVLVKIIGYTTIAQWPTLELVDTNFQSATSIAWRQLRNIDVERQLLFKIGNEESATTYGASVKSILQLLVDRSPFLTSMSGIDIRPGNTSNSDMVQIVQLLAQFENLHSITIGDAKLFNYQPREISSEGHHELAQGRGMSLENMVEFLESTRSRTTLKEMRLYAVQCLNNSSTILDRFRSSFVNGREIQSPFMLEKLTFSSSIFPLHDYSTCISLDTLDTTQLTDVRLGNASIDPKQLTNLIERATNLHRIELAFLRCGSCRGRHREANKKLLVALAAHENLAVIKFNRDWWFDPDCSNAGREFVEMFKVIGCRGKLRKLAMDNHFLDPYDSIERTTSDEILTTVHDYIHCLQSIKLDISLVSGERLFKIVSLPELEEIYFTKSSFIPRMDNVVSKIAQLSNLKRLAITVISEVDTNSLGCLADVTTLMDLRTDHARLITADIYDRWSNGFAPNWEILMLRKIAERNHADEDGLVRLLRKAVGLRVLILHGHITDQSLMAIAECCPKLEILGVQLASGEITIQRLQDIVDRCPRLKRLGGIGDERRQNLQFPKYRKIGDVDMEFTKYTFDDEEYV